MASKSNKTLRSGFTTGACAAAAAKAATLALLGRPIPADGMIHISFPGGERHGLRINWTRCGGFPQGIFASVIKDAGDDPDVTNGVEIIAKVVLTRTGPGAGGQPAAEPVVTMTGGVGVGKVTRPGLAVPIGEPAINPVPRAMIREAVREALLAEPGGIREPVTGVDVTIWVPEGESIARKTLNSRLGIVGGISILGTTGIVRPISSEAWTATIATSMNVAEAMGLREIVISSGRSSEKAHMAFHRLPEESYVMMGDYVEFALLEATKHRFLTLHLVAQWAKMLKIAMATPQTHVRHGAIDLARAAAFLRSLGCSDFPGRNFNTAREMYDAIVSTPGDVCRPLLSRVCSSAREYAESLAKGIPVLPHLISYEGEVITQHG